MVLISFYCCLRIWTTWGWWRHNYSLSHTNFQCLRTFWCSCLTMPCCLRIGLIVSLMENICICIFCVSIALYVTPIFCSTITLCVCNYFWPRFLIMILHIFFQHNFLNVFCHFFGFSVFFPLFSTCVISSCSFFAYFSITYSHV